MRRRLQDELTSLRQSLDIPMVLVTHDFEDVMRLATHLVVLKEGRVVANGTLHSLASHPDTPWLRDTVGLGSVLEATVLRVHPTRGLIELGFDGGVLFASARQLSEGTRVRVRIPHAR